MAPFLSEPLAQSLLAGSGMDAQFVALTGSTNNALKAAGRRRAFARPRLLAAFAQETPRGTKGRAWQPPELGLYFSVGLRVRERCGLYAVAAGIAVVEAGRGFGLDLSLKWPNDIWAAGGKAGGILCELVQDDSGEESLIVGVGCNLKLAPEQRAARTTNGWPMRDFSSAGGEALAADAHARTAFVAAAAMQIVERIENLRRTAPSRIQEDWARADAFFGQAVHWSDSVSDAVRIGIDRGIDAEGRLLMAPLQPGEPWRCLSGELCSLKH